MVATHSPILLAFPGALVLTLDDGGIRPAVYEDLPGVAVHRAVLADPPAFMRTLLGDEEP